MTDAVRGPMTPARMKRIWEREKGICWLCTKPVPMRGGDLVRYDHRIPFEICQHDRDENIFPIHRHPCDALKFAADQEAIARARRRRKNHEGTATPTKNPIQSRGFQKGGPKRAWPKRSFPSRK